MASHPIRRPHLSLWNPAAAPSARFDRPLPRHRVAHRRPVVMAAPAAYAEPMPIRYDSAYHLDAGDRLRVVVYGQEGLTNTYAIDAGGSITMPLIGSVPARGRTTARLATEIAAKLRKGFIREPSVAVEVEAYRPFFILGEVAAPGQYPYVPNMTVESAVAIAGGFSPRARRDQRHSHAHRCVRNGALCRAAWKSRSAPATPCSSASDGSSANKYKSRTGLTCAGNVRDLSRVRIFFVARAMGVTLHQLR